MNKEKIGATLILAFVTLAMGAGICYLIWQAMSQVPLDTARLWALLATVLLPVVAWAGWWFGHTEARGRLAGIDQAVDKVMGAASKAAGLRVETSRQMQRSVVREPPVVVLPDVEIVQRRLPSDSNIVEL